MLSIKLLLLALAHLLLQRLLLWLLAPMAARLYLRLSKSVLALQLPSRWLVGVLALGVN
jgi:hypothetical protein